MSAEGFSWPQYRSCTVKRRHRSYRMAQLYAWWRMLRGERFHPYACDFCGGFHTGHYSERPEGA